METNDLIEFGRWVRKGAELIDNELPLYDFLYRLEKFMVKKNNIEKTLLKYISNVKKNVEKITSGYAFANIDTLIKELENNIIIGNYFSTFYNVETLAERIFDLIIQKENDLLDEEEREKIVEDMKKGKFTLQSKIDLVEKTIHKKHQTEDMSILIKIVYLLQRMRNKFMFHIGNYDDYQFVFGDDTAKKEEFLKNKILKPVLTEIEKVEAAVKGKLNERLAEYLLEWYHKYWTKLCNFYEENKSDEKTPVLNIDIYQHFPQNFAELSYIFILFFGKPDLNLFKN